MTSIRRHTINFYSRELIDILKGESECLTKNILLWFQMTENTKVQKDLWLKLLGIYDAIVNLCPNKRVAHLALNGQTHKIRKKNLHRAIKILEKEN